MVRIRRYVGAGAVHLLKQRDEVVDRFSGCERAGSEVFDETVERASADVIVPTYDR
jgi:hypothetical protein